VAHYVLYILSRYERIYFWCVGGSVEPHVVSHLQLNLASVLPHCIMNSAMVRLGYLYQPPHVLSWTGEINKHTGLRDSVRTWDDSM